MNVFGTKSQRLGEIGYLSKAGRVRPPEDFDVEKLCSTRQISDDVVMFQCSV